MWQCCRLTNKNELSRSLQFPIVCNTKKTGEEKAVVKVMELSSEPVCLIVCEELPCYGVLTVVEAQQILFFLAAAFVKFGAVELFKSWIV